MKKLFKYITTFVWFVITCLVVKAIDITAEHLGFIATTKKVVSEGASSVVSWTYFEWLVFGFWLLSGAVIALWIENWAESLIEKRRLSKSAPKKLEAGIFVYTENEHDPNEYSIHPTLYNIRKAHITNPSCRTFFIEFQDPLKECVIEVFAKDDEIKWCEWDSTERYLFINFETLPHNSWFVVLVSDGSVTTKRRQGMQEIKSSIAVDYQIAIEYLEDLTGSDIRKDNENTNLT